MSKSNLLLMLILLTISVACEKENGCTQESLSQYRYDSSTGKCINCLGQTGYNKVDTLQARLTKNCECMDLSNQELAMLKEGVTKETLSAWPVLEGYNFRGANMDSARLFFAHIKNSDLRGARLASLQYGYAVVRGSMDKFTQHPKEGSCVFSNDSLNCGR